MENIHSITITAEQVAKWREKAREHEREAAILHRRANAGEQILATLKAASEPEPNVGHEIQTPKGEPDNFMGTIRDLANGALKPISKAEMKLSLAKKGFPAKQVQSTYFYVALKKLADKGQISVQEDGSIWKGKKP